MQKFKRGTVQQFTLPAGTTNRHQWHKEAIKAVQGVTDTFDMVRQIYGQHGGESHESLVTVFHFGSEATKNPDAVKIYNDLGEAYGWEINKKNAASIARIFTEALPKCMETVPVEDNRTTAEEDQERHEKTAQAAQARKVLAEEKSERVEELAAELRKQYPNAIGADSGKSKHARAAANFKQILQAKGLSASVKSSSFSMGDSVTARVTTPDIPPAQREEIDEIANLFNYSTFDPMTDSQGYDHSDEGDAWELVMGRAKYCRAEFTQSDECKAAIWSYLQEIGNMTDHERENVRYAVWTGAWGDFWESWAPAKPEPAAKVSGGEGFNIEKHHHTKKDFDFYIVVLADRVERDEFVRLRASCKAAGGWYSRNFGKTPGGFAFREREQAGAWAVQEFGGDTPPDDRPRVKRDSVPLAEDTKKAAKFREMAEKLTPQIENKLGDRLTNTHKRQREAASARIDGNRLQRTQQALNALAGLLESGEITPALRSFSSKKAIYEALGTVMGHGSGCYDIYDTGEPRTTTPEAVALWALLEGKSDEEKAAEELRDKIEKLQFTKIPGYFPTPAELVDEMIDRAEITAAHTVLEPSAGSGAILDGIERLHNEPAIVVVNEINSTLCEVLQAKGYDARPVDFLEDTGEFRYDRVVMNPPFEKLQDMAHVLHAYGKLKDGGRLVAIMSPGPFFRDTANCRDFRAWFERVGGEVHDIEAGAFKESGTGVASKMVIIDRDMARDGTPTKKPVTPQVEAIPGTAPLGINTDEPEQIALF